MHQAQTGIWRDAAELDERNARIFEARDDLVVQPAALDAPAAVVQQHLVCILFDLFTHLFVGVAAENHLGWDTEFKIVHNRFLRFVAGFLAER